ncbi:ubiquitin carboxyl-terminal hydrolase 20 [Condylostylus longicornis]|uniref:ubiquitin carboxyl-terminal hydrolase 20 n=1 Tax=Condylostylus longicornis TaxID=2530218 RepID=UPI00244E3C57|nr:ubiquitin carboxyl-terminal hydrolase 20 [Condylostylus longicornis]
MARNYIKCPHMDNIVQLSLPEICKIKQGQSCSQCEAIGPNLWLCLHRYCLHTGCSEQANDHSTIHFKLNNQHCVHMNLSSQRIWCYLCETEVFLNQRRSSLVGNSDATSEASRFSDRIYERNMSSSIGDTPESSGDEDDGDGQYMDGLVGLQNIANTCYMNAALQALSNSPPLTYYFLDCGDIIEATNEISGNRKPGLAKSYHRLMKEMWLKSKRSNMNYVVPRGILYGIRSVYPMFRGYQQHDTQEFLRCFMDQLHEELKEVTPPPPDPANRSVSAKSKYLSLDERSLGCGSSSTIDDDQVSCSTPSPSQSEAEEYETCDSGVSEQSSLSDEGTPNLSNRPKILAKPLFGSRPSSPGSTSSFIPYSVAGKVSPQHLQKPTMQNEQKQKLVSSPLKLPHRSIISDVFDGKLLSSVQCLTCNRISTREETFQDLSLPIPGKDHLAVLHQAMPSQNQQHQQVPLSPGVNNTNQNSVTCTDAVYQAGQDGWFWWVWNWFRSWFWGPAVTLHDCMAAFFSADELKGDNMYSCEQCNKLRNGIKYSRVLALPEMLCIHLKRFRHDLSYSSKISSPVNFPLTGLDMRPYLHKDCKSEISSYDLTAVICHHGTVGGGHYTSFAKHELSGKWYEFDDQLVSEVTPEVVQNCQAYVLFYRKVNPNMTIIRSQAQELAEMNPPQASDIRFFVSRQWINRFNTFAEPGPIDNWTILCPHGGLPPCKAALIERLAIPLPQPLWDFLYKQFGGGPACNRLFECDTCRRAAESLARRQEAELEAFTRFNNEFQYQEKPVTTIYAISMAWFRQWQLFARGLTTEEPGPINNTTIAAIPEANCMPIRNVKPGSDYAQLNTTLWKFFHEIYGGGPEIILRGGPSEEIKLQKEKETESMDIDHDMKLPQNNTSTSNRSKDDMVNEKSESEVSQIFQTDRSSKNSNSKPKSIVKQTKNVSFEDETEDMISESYSDSINVRSSTKYNDDESRNIASNNASHILCSGSGRRGKYELINKKDKKYRSAMKSSGSNAMFGPEGKYQTQSSLDNNTTESISDNKMSNIDLINANEYQKSEYNPTYTIKNNSSNNLLNLKSSESQSLLSSQIITTTAAVTQQKLITTTTTTTTAVTNSINMNSVPTKKLVRSSLSDETESFLIEHQQQIPNSQQAFQMSNENLNDKQLLSRTVIGALQTGTLSALANTIGKHHFGEFNDQKSLNALDISPIEKTLMINSESFQTSNCNGNHNDSNNNNNNNNFNNNKNSSILSKKFTTGSVGKGHHHRKKIKSKNSRKTSFSQSCTPNQDNGSDSC